METIKTTYYLIRLEDNINNIIDVVHDTQGVVDEILIPISQKQHGLLQYIDPYGDTIFNVIQAQAIMPELEAAFGAAKSKEQTEILEALKRMAITCVNDVHLLIKFYGE